MLVQDVMNKEPLTVSLDTNLKSAIEQMARTQSSCLVVVSNQEPVGIITERDVTHLFLDVMMSDANLKTLVCDVMTKDPVCVLSTSSFKSALMLSRSRKLRHLPVISPDNHLVGVVTQTNLVEAYAGLVDKQDELESSVEQLKLLSLEDPLLGIGNRRAMEVDLTHTEADAKRHHKTYAVALLDVDSFKKYNDTYGHPAGDVCLKQVAQSVKQTIRESDRVYRYGGEELLILMPETMSESASKCAERVRNSIEVLNIKNKNTDLGILTVSLGVADKLEGDWKNLVKKADKALYQAKNSGRNKVAVYHH